VRLAICALQERESLVQFAWAAAIANIGACSASVVRATSVLPQSESVFVRRDSVALDQLPSARDASRGPADDADGEAGAAKKLGSAFQRTCILDIVGHIDERQAFESALDRYGGEHPAAIFARSNHLRRIPRSSRSRRVLEPAGSVLV
jgi:hypothetical protein